MGGFDLFEFFRFLLSVLVCVYCTCRLATVIWAWQGFGRDGSVGSALLRRYLIALVLRARFRRFLYEFSVIGGLSACLVVLLRLH